MTDLPPIVARRNFARPDAAVLEQLRDCPSTWAVNALRPLKIALDFRIKPLDGLPGKIFGTVITASNAPGDNLASSAAMALSQPGDVVVVATGEWHQAAFAGDIALGTGKNRGIAGLVSDGLVRDIEGMRKLGLPIFCMGLSPHAPTGKGPGTVGLPVQIGGITIESGDIVLGDLDGVAIVPRAKAAELAAALPGIRASEVEAEARLAAGQNNTDAVQKLFDEGRIRYLD